MEYQLKFASDNIKLLLKFKGWTQEVLCKKTGITLVTMRRRLSSNGGNWNISEAVNIAKAFNVRLDDIFFKRMTPIVNTEITV